MTLAGSSSGASSHTRLGLKCVCVCALIDCSECTEVCQKIEQNDDVN